MNLGLLWGMILGTLVLSSHSVAAKKVNIMFVTAAQPGVKGNASSIAPAISELMKTVGDIYRPAGIEFVVQQRLLAFERDIFTAGAKGDEATWKNDIVAHSKKISQVISGRRDTSLTGVIKVYLVNYHPYPDVLGITIRGNHDPTLAAFGFVCAINLNPVIPSAMKKTMQSTGNTLAHELGHALLDDGGHPNFLKGGKSNFKNLMAGGQYRTGKTLTKEQIEKMHASSFARD